MRNIERNCIRNSIYNEIETVPAESSFLPEKYLSRQKQNLSHSRGFPQSFQNKKNEKAGGQYLEEEKIRYGLKNDYMFRAAMQSNE